MAYCSSYFLKDGGEIAFVLPRAFFSADHHDNTRRGEAEGFMLKQIWDLDKVAPVFRVPSCVLFAEKFAVSEDEKEKEVLKQKRFDAYTTNGIAGIEFSGALSVHNCNWDYAEELLTEQTGQLLLSQTGQFIGFQQTANEQSKGKSV